MLTVEDYKKIEKWLGQRAVKDSQFSMTPSIDNDDLIPLIHDGKNHNMSVSEFKKYTNWFKDYYVMALTNPGECTMTNSDTDGYRFTFPLRHTDNEDVSLTIGIPIVSRTHPGLMSSTKFSSINGFIEHVSGKTYIEDISSKSVGSGLLLMVNRSSLDPDKPGTVTESSSCTIPMATETVKGLMDSTDKTDLKNVKETTAVLKNDVSTLKSKTLVLENNNSTLKTDVSSLKTRMLNLEQETSNLESDVETLGEKIDSIVIPDIPDIPDFDYTVNGYAIKENPVLSATDITLGESNIVTGGKVTPVQETDSLRDAVWKLNDRSDKATTSLDRLNNLTVNGNKIKYSGDTGAYTVDVAAADIGIEGYTTPSGDISYLPGWETIKDGDSVSDAFYKIEVRLNEIKGTTVNVGTWPTLENMQHGTITGNDTVNVALQKIYRALIAISNRVDALE